MPARFSPRQRLGAAVLDVPRVLWGLRPGPRSGAAPPWVFVRNRRESLIADAQRTGVRCDWQWTSMLHAVNVFPGLGRLLMRRALADWPISFADRPPGPAGRDVELSFVIGHRGKERLPLLLPVLRSIAAQREVAVECVVVEQSAEAEAADAMPSWVRRVHSPPPRAHMPYCRAWALNVGARCARGTVLVLSDGDILVPEQYAARITRHYRQGFEVINLKRFVFFLDEKGTAGLVRGGGALNGTPPLFVMQNAEGGGTLAVSRRVYEELGGLDESFVGWGGEDNEFWDRAQALRLWPYGYLPFVHLWHPAQPSKGPSSGPAARLLAERLRESRDARRRRLASLDWGDLRGPVTTGRETAVGGSP